MNKLFTFLCAVVLFSSISFAQFNSAKPSIGGLIGFGGGAIDGDGAIPIAVEYNFYQYNKNIQLGGIAAFASSEKENPLGTWTLTSIIFGAQGNYHFSPGEKFDPFAGLTLGYNIVSDSWKNKDGSSGTTPNLGTVGGLVYSGQIGFNYWFKPNLAAQVRVGYFPYFGVGVTYNLD